MNRNTSASVAAQKWTAKELALDAMFIALVLVATMFINVRLPLPGNGGLIHLGNVPLFVAAILFGRRTAMIAGGVGMALFDLISGWAAWTPFTLVIVGSMGFVMGSIVKRKGGNSIIWDLLGILAACFIKIAGYYLAEVVLYGNWAIPLASIPGNLLQIWLAAVVAVPLGIGLNKMIKKQIRN